MSPVLLAICLNQGQQDPPLSAFVGRDLTKLSGVEASQYRVALERVAGAPKGNSWPPFEPRYLVKYPAGRASWISISVYPGYDVPDMSGVEAHTFTLHWKHLARISMPTGYRLRTTSAAIVHDPHSSIDLLKIHVESVGPFMSVNGGPQKPAFRPETGVSEWYAFTEDRAMLVRLTDGNGKLLPNSYGWAAPDIGPDSSRHSVRFWQDDLRSNDVLRQLECMVWLSGSHLTSRDWRAKNVSREPVSASKVYESVRNSAPIRKRLADLVRSNNNWVAEYAKFTLARLATPQQEERR